MKTLRHAAWLVLCLAALVAAPEVGGDDGKPSEPATVWRPAPDATWEILEGRGSITAKDGGWTWSSGRDSSGQVGIRLPVDLDDYDELRFEFRPTQGPVLVTVTTAGFPAATYSRNWYSKNVQRQGEWNPMYADLRLDDDGRAGKAAGGQALWIRFEYAEPAQHGTYSMAREVELRNVRLVRHPLRWQSDFFRVRTQLRDGRYEILYPVTFINRDPDRREAVLHLDRLDSNGTDPLFRFERQTPFTIEPRIPEDPNAFASRWGTGFSETDGDVTTAWITFSADAAEVAKRPGLYAEVVWPRLTVTGCDEPLVPLRSSRIDPWILALPPKEVVHPSVEATPAMLERAVARNAANPQFKGVLDAQVTQAEGLLKAPWDMPRQNDGLKVFEPGKAPGGRGPWTQLHDRNVARCLTLARAYGLTGRQDFRDAALEVLGRYADAYPFWDALRPTTTAFADKSAVNSLASGFRYPGFFIAYDYLRPSLDCDWRRTIEDRLLEPIARTADGHVPGYSNQMAVHNLLPFSYAVSTERWCLAMRYVVGPRGLAALREYAFDADGLGLERDLGYHFNAMDPMVQTMITLTNLGYDDSAITMKSVMDAPMAFVDQGPAHGDFAFRYEWAYARYRDPRYPNIFLQSHQGKRGIAGLLFGVEAYPEPTATIPAEPVHLPNSGNVVLRQQLPNGSLRKILCNYGSPYLRGHIDLMSVHIWEAGKELTRHTPVHGWYSTIADSLLAVNGRDQITGRGRLVRMEQAEQWMAMEVATDPAAPLYEPPVDYRRLVVGAPDFVLLLDRASAKMPVDYDWAFYPGQTITVPAGWTPSSPPKLEARKDVGSVVGLGGPLYAPERHDWRKPSARLSQLEFVARVKGETTDTPVRMLTTPAQLPYAFTATGNEGAGVGDALLLVADQQREAAWAAVFDRSASQDVMLEWVPLLDPAGKPLPSGRGVAVKVTAPSGTWIIAVAEPEQPARVAGAGPLENGWLIVRQ